MDSTLVAPARCRSASQRAEHRGLPLAARAADRKVAPLNTPRGLDAAVTRDPKGRFTGGSFWRVCGSAAFTGSSWLSATITLACERR